jgi:Recombination endonuclease VII
MCVIYLKEKAVVLKCTKCKEIKPSTEFHKRHDKKNGFASHCKKCRNFLAVDKTRKWRLINLYGVTEEFIQNELKRQNYSCALCGEYMDKPYIDHDHKLGKFRGLIHFKCNILLGHAGDNAGLLKKASSYLLRHA